MKRYKSLSEAIVQWYITKYDEDGNSKLIQRFDTYNQEEIQKIFDKEVKKLQPDEELWFQKDDKKYVGETILVVTNRKGKFVREVTKGSQTFYKPYNFKF